LVTGTGAAVTGPWFGPGGGRQPESQQPLLHEEPLKHEGMESQHGPPIGPPMPQPPKPMSGQQPPTQQRLPQQTGLKAL
jgi:hypothetical protein